jgi:hypothetical protein
MDIDFFCPIHKEYYLKDSNSLLCKKCGIPVVKKQGIYDFIMQKSEDQSRWDAAFEQDTKKAGILKKAFDALLWKFLPDLLNGYAVARNIPKMPDSLS